MALSLRAMDSRGLKAERPKTAAARNDPRAIMIRDAAPFHAGLARVQVPAPERARVRVRVPRRLRRPNA